MNKIQFKIRTIKHNEIKMYLLTNADFGKFKYKQDKLKRPINPNETIMLNIPVANKTKSLSHLNRL